MALTEADFAGAPGNWLAQEIRRFQEKSKGLFPSPKPGDDRTRFRTIYGIDYVPIDRQKFDTPAALKRPGVKKEAPFNLEQAKRFNTWKIRNDLVQVEKVQQKVAERRRTALELAQTKETHLPEIQRGHSVPNAAETRSNLPPQTSTAMPIPAVRSPEKSEVRMSAPAAVNDRTAESRLKTIKKELLEAAEAYMARDPQADRRVIDKALATSNFKEDLSEQTSELANPKKEVEKWLEQANEQEQALALNFFKSVTGMRLMGVAGNQERLSELLSTLESGEAKQPLPKMTHEDEQKVRTRKQRNLQFLRILSPATRDSRFQYQSWHHLPTYKPVSRTDNIRSHFTQPQKVKPLHFTIHPDWGP